jgi:hypothetical protein
MFKIISQIVFLIIFLFLTIFVTVWFNDSEEYGAMADNREPASWLSESVKVTGSVISLFLSKTEDKPDFQDNNNMVEDETVDGNSSFTTDVSEMYNGINDSALKYVNDENGEKHEFRDFVGGIVKKAPEYYLDVKLYNNSWQKFWSFYWLKYKEIVVEK